MLTIPAKTKTARDGTLSLKVSTGIPDAEVDVLIVIETSRSGVNSIAPIAEWPKGYFELFGSLREVNLAAVEDGRLRGLLAAAGTPIGPNDLMIAAIALSRQLTLVTHNTREFSRGAGLLVEDWESL